MAESSRDERAGVYNAMNDGDSHSCISVDVAKAGLSDYGKPGNYFARQVQRWSEQYRASETGTIADMDRLIAWLAEHMPPDDGRVSLVHGDFRIDNMIFAAEAPRLLAVLDWELVDARPPVRRSRLSVHAVATAKRWRFSRARRAGPSSARHPVSDEEYVAAYCRRTGIPGVPHWPFLIAFSFFRIAAIVQGVYKRALDGNASNPERGRRMGAGVPLMAKLAMAEAEKA